MRWAAAVSEEPKTAEALEDTLARVGSGLGGEDPDLLVLFASDHASGDEQLITRFIRAAFPEALLIGCAGRSVIGAGREVEERPGLSLTGAVLPDVALSPFHLESNALPDTADAWRKRIDLESRSPAEGEPAFLLLPDPFSCDADDLLGRLDLAFPESVKVGGLASGSTEPGGNALYLGSEIARSGVVGLALAGQISVDAVVAQGCRPVGTPLFATRTRENVLLEVDGRASLEVLQDLYDAAGELDKVLFRSSLFLGMEMRADQTRYGRGDFLVRNLIGSDSETGAIAVSAPIREGQIVQFHLRDAETSAADLEERLAGYRERTAGEPGPEGALLFSCLGRGRELYGRPDHDTDAFRRHFGDVPLGGFFCNGEIGPVQGRTFLHGYTSSFGLFRPFVDPGR